MYDAEKASIIDLARELDVRLDGKPATVAGRLEPFAVVAALDGSASIQWSWATVARMVRAAESKGRRVEFKSK